MATYAGTMRVAAVVVTYNRVELLKKTLTALEAQEYPVSKIVVVDIASTDATQQMLKERKNKLPIEVHRLKKNTGGAGGFFFSMDVAYDGGYDAFWMMDDDTKPRPESLGKLVRGLEEAAEFRGGQMPSYAASMVVWKDGRACDMNIPTPRWDWTRPIAEGKNWIDVDCASFVSCLVTREAVEACGLPHPEYFIWFDDAEYTYRLAKWRPGIFVPDSVVDHLMPANSAVFWGEATEKNLWKFGRGARNQVAAAISLRKARILADLFQNLISQLKGSSVPWKVRAKLVRFALDGFFLRPKVRYPRAMKKD